MTGHTQFFPPSVEQVKAYCSKHRLPVDPERFVDYYTAVGWMVGRTPMQDWKAAVRSWKGKELKNGKTEYPNTWTVGTVV